MPSFLQVENISKSYGDHTLFEGISFNINEGDKIALVAPNGTGKSSMLRILAGVEPSDGGGEVRFMSGIRVAFLDQNTAFDADVSIFDTVYARLGERTEVIRKYETAVASGDSARIEAAMTAMERADAWDAEQNIRQVLSSLKIEHLERKVGTLSGGERKRVALACMLLQQAQFLVMDEPTNHLDTDIIEFLEGYLQKSRCTLLMVTHDRYFLDRVCNTIFEIDRGELFAYRGNYEQYLQKREERYENMQAGIDKARNLLRRELEWIRSTPQARTGKAQYRIDAFYDLRDRAAVSLHRDELQIDSTSARLGRKIIDCEGVSFGYGERKLVDNFTYKFVRGERVGIVGRNGVGKSTFIKLLTAELTPQSGTIEWGETLRIGYYHQDGMSFRSGQTVLDTVRDIADQVKDNGGGTVSVTALLNRFLFPVETFNKRVDLLSGGEQRRLYLLTVLMQNPNFLVLDEPTNDLDIMTLCVLEEYLQSFEGCLMIVSHDRCFLDKTVEHLFVLSGDGAVRNFMGDYSQYRAYMRDVDAAKAREERAAKSATPATPRTSAAPAVRRLSFKEQRELEQLEKNIAALEDEKSTLEQRLGEGGMDYTALQTASERVQAIINELDEKEMRWLELSE